MALSSFPNTGHLLMDENAEYASNNDRDTYLLSTPLDGESLSDRQCYVRSHFVELFIATQADVSARHSRGAQKLHLNQIGLRCAYCVKLKPRDRAERAICYPSSISRIYQTVADMQRFHFESCVAIPPKVLHTYKGLKTTRPRGVGSPQSYWDKSAREIGLLDTSEGIQVVGNVAGSVPGGVMMLEGQKKSVVTGMLEQMDNGGGHGQGAMLHQGGMIQVKEEHVDDLGQSSLHQAQPTFQGGPQDVVNAEDPSSTAAGPVPPMPSVSSTSAAAVVSSPGSDNASKEEDKEAMSTPGASDVPSISFMDNNNNDNNKNKAANNNTGASDEDANILLMLKKTPESPPRNNGTTIKEEERDIVNNASAAAKDIVFAV